MIAQPHNMGGPTVPRDQRPDVSGRGQAKKSQVRMTDVMYPHFAGLHKREGAVDDRTREHTWGQTKPPLQGLP
jgi:hypothetical protein